MRHSSNSTPVTLRSTPHSDWYVSSIERLIGIVQDLSLAHSLKEVIAIVRDEARHLTGADGSTFVLRDGDLCYYAEENAIGPLWKGMRFPMTQCISGWVMLNAQPAVIEDIYSDKRVPSDTYRPTFVKSLVMVPIRRSAPIGAIGNYWASRRLPSVEQVAVLQALADTASVALENAELYGELQSKIKMLQQRESVLHEQRDMLEVFTRALAHDLKEPIRTVHWVSESIDKDNLLPEKKREYFQYIKNAAKRMNILIDSVFQYSQLDSFDKMVKESCDMEYVLAVAKDSIKRLIQERNVTIKSNKLPQVYANTVQMIQVFQSLLSNAIKHHHRPSKNIVIQVNAIKQEREWRFVVADNGSGIAEEHLKKIFLPFKRVLRKDECAGLGLAICQKIIHHHDGKIWCESEQNEGATFFFTLPLNEGGAVVKEITVSEQVKGNLDESTSLASVLLVDDMHADIELTKNIFEHEKFQCNLIIAYDAENAIKKLDDEITKGNEIDVMLLDINMPGTDGFELLERIRCDKRMKHVNVIMCSGSAYHKDAQRAEALGAIGYMVKPPSVSKLKKILDTAHKDQKIPLLQQVDDGYTLIKNHAIN